MNWEQHDQYVPAHTAGAKNTVLSFIDAMNNEDFTGARRYAAENMTFDGVLGSRNGADAYFSDMKKMKLKYDVLKVFTDGADVCLFYNIEMSGKNIFTSGWYRVSEGKINSIRVVFDPRPLL